MAYLSKKTVLKAYEILSSIDEDKNQGLTQKVSALKYGAALDMFFKIYHKNCNLKLTKDKEFFSLCVGEIVKINDFYNTKDFYLKISENGRDFDCGSNFYSQSSVKDSKTNPIVTFKYPKRSGWEPVLEVKNEELLYDINILTKGLLFYLDTVDLQLAFVLWLLRFKEIKDESFEGVRESLKNIFTKDFCDALFVSEIGFDNCNYIEYSEEICILEKDDFLTIFSEQNTINLDLVNIADISNKTIEEEYIEFLKITTPKSVSNYSSSSFGRIGRTLKSIFKTDKDVSIYSYTTVETVKQIIDILQSNREFLEYNETGRRQYSNALDWYVKFLTLRSMFSNIRDMQVKNNQDLSDKPLQQIYYGAPGTGKSHTINEVTKGVSSDFVFRTTFHPDSDYSTFVGAYKPTMKKLPIYNSQNGDKIGEEEKIAYSFVAQSFLKAYVTAWQNREQAVYLVIEEINRGNCAQIFGDLFQLLDRKEDGVSEYPIKADQDMQDYLRDKFADCVGLPENIKSGDELLLPSNLYIWATMNTSDQSLFPIDSAFKRRWDWQYMPIKNAEKGWVIKVKDENGTKKYDWWEFIKKINAEIDDLTSSEDKKLGYFFCKAKDKVVSADMFVNKVMFYLWNDVVKDYDLSGRKAFQDDDGKVLTFGKFYDDQARAIKKMMENLGVNEINDENNDASASDADASVGVFAVNGESFKVLGDVVYRAVELFVNNNPTMKDIDVANAWKQIKGTGTGFKYLVETAAEHNARKAISTDARFDNRAKVLTTPMSEILYVSTEWTKEMVSNFMDQVNAQGWEITITKVAE